MKLLAVLLQRDRVLKRNCAAAEPAYALASFGAVQLAFNPCSKLQGIQAKANKLLSERLRQIRAGGGNLGSLLRFCWITIMEANQP